MKNIFGAIYNVIDSITDTRGKETYYTSTYIYAYYRDSYILHLIMILCLKRNIWDQYKRVLLLKWIWFFFQETGLFCLSKRGWTIVGIDFIFSYGLCIHRVSLLESWNSYCVARIKSDKQYRLCGMVAIAMNFKCNKNRCNQFLGRLEDMFWLCLVNAK